LSLELKDKEKFESINEGDLKLIALTERMAEIDETMMRLKKTTLETDR